MSARSVPQIQPAEPDAASGAVRLGARLFRRRTVLPIPLALAVLLLPQRFSQDGSATLAAGLVSIAVGESIRLWGVRHIGAISRTRADRLGPLVSSGPFALVRNPLYIGNVALWVGFALLAGFVWLVPVFILVLGVEYHAIVRWEEVLLQQRLGGSYREYMAHVPRWVPNLSRGSDSSGPTRFSWSETLHSERGTLIAIAVGLGLLWLKAHFFA